MEAENDPLYVISTIHPSQEDFVPTNDASIDIPRNFVDSFDMQGAPTSFEHKYVTGRIVGTATLTPGGAKYMVDVVDPTTTEIGRKTVEGIKNGELKETSISHHFQEKAYEDGQNQKKYRLIEVAHTKKGFRSGCNVIGWIHESELKKSSKLKNDSDILRIVNQSLIQASDEKMSERAPPPAAPPAAVAQPQQQLTSNKTEATLTTTPDPPQPAGQTPALPPPQPASEMLQKELLSMIEALPEDRKKAWIETLTAKKPEHSQHVRDLHAQIDAMAPKELAELAKELAVAFDKNKMSLEDYRAKETQRVQKQVEKQTNNLQGKLSKSGASEKTIQDWLALIKGLTAQSKASGPEELSKASLVVDQVVQCSSALINDMIGGRTIVQQQQQQPKMQSPPPQIRPPPQIQSAINNFERSTTPAGAALTKFFNSIPSASSALQSNTYTREPVQQRQQQPVVQQQQHQEEYQQYDPSPLEPSAKRARYFVDHNMGAGFSGGVSFDPPPPREKN